MIGYFPVPITRFNYWSNGIDTLSNLFKYQISFDASGDKCHSNCEHPLENYYEWDFDDVSPKEITKQPKIIHYYSRQGTFNPSLKIKGTCPHPNFAICRPKLIITWKDLTIVKRGKKYGENIKSFGSVLALLYTLYTIYTKIITHIQLKINICRRIIA